MSCCPNCQHADEFFDKRTAYGDLKAYQRNGPAKATQFLLDSLRTRGVEGLSLLDIGGGVGVIQHELVKAGVSKTTDVDASRAYLAVAQEEAQRRGYQDRAEYHYGDFVQLAPNLEEVDIVTLDRVICCYPDMPALVKASSGRARRYYGAVYPRDAWWTRLGVKVLNFFMKFSKTPFPVFIHPADQVDAMLRENGMVQKAHRYFGIWQAVLYERQ